MLAFASLCATAQAQDDPRLTAITAHVEDMVQRFDLPGAVLLVNQDGRQVYARAFGGYALDTRLPIASASKWISATVLARLVDQGVLDWDDRIDRYASAIPADKAEITLRQLFSLTSALPGGEQGASAPCLGDRSITLEACARRILSLPLTATPGTVFDYGGNSMQVAGWMAERASGREWNALFRETLAAPLGLVATDYGLFPGADAGNPRIAGGVFSTAPDYLRMLQMLLDDGRHAGQRLLEPETVAEMQRKQTTGTLILGTPYADSAGYGLGEWIDAQDAQGRSLEVSSGGAFGFMPWLDLRRDIAGVFATLGDNSELSPDLFALRALVAAALDKDTSNVPFADFGGIWWNPAESGAGYTLVQRVDHRLILAWYTYDELGAQQWLLAASGEWSGSDRWSSPLYRTRHDASGAISAGVDAAAIVTSEVGRVALTFVDANHAELSFSVDGIARTVAIERFAF